MSEYQYFEWQTLDRPLTPKERAEVEELSSHITVSAASAWVEYHWSSFRHNPEEVLARYFDAFLYMANWGDRQVMFRFPQGLLDLDRLEPYYQQWHIDWKTIGDHDILNLNLSETEIEDWVEGGGILARLAPLRNEILAGDLRALYLTWLALVEHGLIDEEELEPPVPGGLNSLSASLSTLAEFFDLDAYFLAAAAENSPPSPAAMTSDALTPALAQLTRAECEDYLRRLLQGDGQVAWALRQRLLEIVGKPAISVSPSQRTASEVIQRAEELAEAERRRRQDELEKRHHDFLVAMAPRQKQLWQEVEAYIEKRYASAYGDAVYRLRNLREIAAMENKSDEFQRKLNELHDRYARYHALIRRLNEVGLVRK